MSSSDCVHHWLTQAPDGNEQLQAVCKKCQATRSFPAWPEQKGFIDNKGAKETYYVFRNPAQRGGWY